MNEIRSLKVLLYHDASQRRHIQNFGSIIVPALQKLPAIEHFSRDFTAEFYRMSVYPGLAKKRPLVR
jgi:hypothetical protein